MNNKKDREREELHKTIWKIANELRGSVDGGIDLEGIGYGVINNNDDSVKYIVQAKRFKPFEKIAVDIIDKLRGNMASGEKGIVITTAMFSSPARLKAETIDDRPIVLIDGKMLVDIYIENNIGFVYKPVFSYDELNKFYKKNSVVESIVDDNANEYIVSDIEKDITANDIKDVKISSDGRYFSQGITEMYRKYGLLTKDNVFNPSKSVWKYDGKTIYRDLIY